jgi:putative peptide zinc metalloprotease protein
LARVLERERELVLRSPADGRFSVPNPQDLPGRFVKQGESLGQVVPDTLVTARVMVPQQTVDMVRLHTDRVSVRLAESFSDIWPARILREVPRASDRLPNMALAQSGGGEVALDPTMPKRCRRISNLKLRFLPHTRRRWENASMSGLIILANRCPRKSGVR